MSREGIVEHIASLVLAVDGMMRQGLMSAWSEFSLPWRGQAKHALCPPGLRCIQMNSDMNAQ